MKLPEAIVKREGNKIIPNQDRRNLIQGIASLCGVAALAACSSEEPKTPVDKLVEKFLLNFNPYEYAPLAEKAFDLSGRRDSDPGSKKVCKDQESLTMDSDELVNFLISCKTRERILEFFESIELQQNVSDYVQPENIEERELEENKLRKARALDVDNMIIGDAQANNDLYRIFALLGRDPEMYIAFLRASLTYRGWDLSSEDTFRDPVSTLRSGWADCDDFTVMHYFWAHILKYSPNLVVAVTPESEAVDNGPNTKTQNAHTLVWYLDETRGKMVVLDNGSFTLLEPGSDIGEYLRDEYPSKNLSVEFNGPYEA